MNEHEIVFVDFFNVLGQKSSFFVDHLPGSDDFCFAGVALMVFPLQFLEILIDEHLIVEGDGVLVRFVPIDDASKFVAPATVSAIFVIVLFLLLDIGLKLSDAPLTFEIEFLLLLYDVFLLNLFEV